MLLSALDAGARGDLQAEADAWLEDVWGFPAYSIIMGSISTHVANVVAIASGYELTTTDAMRLAKKRFGEYNLPETVPQTRAVVITPKNGKGTPLYFESAERISEAIVAADRWKLLPGDPRKSALPFDDKVSKPCDRDDCSEVVAVCGHEQLVEKMGVVNEAPWDKSGKTYLVHDLEETPWGSECVVCGGEAPFTEWCPGKEEDPTQASPDSPAAVEGGDPGPTSIALLASIPAATSVGQVISGENWTSEQDAEQGYRDVFKALVGDTGTPSGEATPGPHQEDSAPSVPGGDKPNSGEEQDLINRVKAATDAIAAKANAEGNIAPLDWDDGLVECERCQERVKPGNTIVDEFGARRCGTCHRGNLMGFDDPTKFCQEHQLNKHTRFRIDECPTCKSQRGADPSPGDGSSECSSTGEEETLVICGVESPATGQPCDKPKDHDGLHRGASFAQGIPPEDPCGLCDHLGKSHDHKTKRCAQCTCTCFVPLADMPEVRRIASERREEMTIPPRWMVNCPACPSSKMTSEDPSGKPCPDCGCKTPILSLCGEPSDASPFDWARFLVKHAVRIEANQPRRCRVCEDSVNFGAKVWQHANNRASIAHESCVTEELGYAVVMLSEGKLITAELNEEAADKGEAKKIMCAICGKNIEPGEMCYSHGDSKVFAHYVCVEGEASEPPISDGDERNLCEWNPEKKRESAVGDPFHSLAHVVVGSGKHTIHLCHSCRKLKPHSRLRKEVPIAAPAEPSAV